MLRRSSFYRCYWALERLIVPGLVSSQRVYAKLLGSFVNNRSKWLDLGCGHQIYPEWIHGQKELAARAGLFVGLDPDHASIKQHCCLRHKVVGLELPFRDNSFTLVTANMVFEHLANPKTVLSEIRRVLEPGGMCIFHTPNRRYWQTALAIFVPQTVKNKIIKLMEQRDEDDVYPTHYRINTVDEVTSITQEMGFGLKEIRMLNTSSAGRIFFGPFVLLELAWIRLLEVPFLRNNRSNIIAVISR